ncbi:MAG: enoyl-CoA hydratase/isomerase family protein [Ignavibacteria bacterium]|nr:enoyl-CoA hydratase/isomerase family protein [Ignavibacteria bacterium]
MKDYQTISLVHEKGRAVVTLSRPQLHNAFNYTLLEELIDVFTLLESEESVRIIILTGAGKSFCAGADLNFMKDAAKNSFEQNYEESLRLDDLMQLIYLNPKPVIAKVNGSAFGGGVGLIAACDIVIAVDSARFAFTEVRLGLAPAVISPYVTAKIGNAAARELFITGEQFTAEKALLIGLLNAIVPAEKLNSAVDEKVEIIIKNGPEAIKSIKQMNYENWQLAFPELRHFTAKLIATLRRSKEGQEGMAAFLEKRKPGWIAE